MALGFLGQFECDPGVSWQMVLRRIATAVQIHGQCGGALFERLAEEIDSADDQRQRLGNSFAASALGTWMAWIGWHRVSSALTARG
jgi:hypothetical protein